jgi:hypothetical protein
VNSDILSALAVVFVVGSPVWLILLIFYLKKLGMRNLQSFASGHQLALTQNKPPTVEGDISGRNFQYVAGFAKRKEMFFEFWRVKLKGKIPHGLAVFPAAFSFYLFPRNSIAKASLDEIRSRIGDDFVATGDQEFDSSFMVACDDPDGARQYLTPSRRQALHDIGRKGGFLCSNELIVERERSRFTVKVLNKHLTGLLKAAEALDEAS